MAEINPTPPITKASWDEMNCRIFLQLLVDEIDAGIRPSGQFTKQAWGTITNKFKDLSGCNFSQAQLKNKWDNLKKDFALWEKLLHEESGLGYDYCSGRGIAEPSWWRQKIQIKIIWATFGLHNYLRRYDADDIALLNLSDDHVDDDGSDNQTTQPFAGQSRRDMVYMDQLRDSIKDMLDDR